jgi:hypothetical protein
VPLWKHGCEVAALDSYAEQPAGYLLIAAASRSDTWAKRGDRIPGIITVARYTYTTTTRYVPTEVLAISPPSGPCDGVVEATLTGFGPSTPVRIDIGRPYSDVSMGIVATVTTDASGQFRGQIQLGDLGCEAASIDGLRGGPTGPKEIHIWAKYQSARQSVAAWALYTYTTTEPGGGLVPHKLPAAGAGTAAQPQPTLVLSPSSGPCDATVEVRGEDFAPHSFVRILVGEPTTGAGLGEVASVSADSLGRFARSASLGSLACAGARLADKVAPGAGRLEVWASAGEPLYGLGSLPPVVARAVYLFATFEISRPEPTLTVLPDTGPCDARVTVEAAGFEPSYEILVSLMRPHSEGSLGTLAEAVTDGEGALRISLSLGALGCEGAALDMQADPSERGDLGICARTGGWSECTRYSYTTTTAGAAPAPSELPATGDGAEVSGAHRLPLAVPLALAGSGLLLVLLALSARAKAR